MSKFVEIDVSEFKVSPFSLIKDEWMLITAKADGKVNTMTANWGALGELWYKYVSFIFVRPGRYTYQFIENSDTYSLTFFDRSFRDKLAYLGKVSGRDEDKIKKCELDVVCDPEFDTPYFEQASAVIICKKIHGQVIDPNCFVDKSIDEVCFPRKDYHTMYVGEVMKVLIRQDD